MCRKNSGGVKILRRFLRYADKVFDLSSQIDGVKDGRIRPRIAISTVISSCMVMTLARLGSLNALEQTGNNRFWRKWIGAALPSADTIGKVFSVVDCEQLRKIIKHLYGRAKRNKALKPSFEGRFALILDGHESHSGYLKCCEGCLQRVIHKSKGDKIQYYHRHVMAQLMCGNFYLPLDMEPQRPGEDEVAAAERLLKRVLKNYPRAFSLILTDGLYVRAGFFQLALAHSKDVIAVLKDERRDLLKDARGLFKLEKSTIYETGKVERECWDVEHFTSWTQFSGEVRVVRSLETSYVKRQRTKKIEKKVSDWVWVSTISKQRLATENFVNFGHGRWKIENTGFNELVNYWHANHVYRHHPVAIEAFGLLTMAAFILFHAFINLNLKPEIRFKHTKLHWANMITTELYLLLENTKMLLPP